MMNIREKSGNHLYDNDMCRGKNFFNQIVKCQSLRRIAHHHFFRIHNRSLKGKSRRYYVFNKYNILIRITYLKE